MFPLRSPALRLPRLTRRVRNESDQQRVIDDLAQKYHINALQFYDWMYRHETQFLTKATSRTDLVPVGWGEIRDTIQGLITFGPGRLSMLTPYSMSYAAQGLNPVG